ncbi:PilZ domain-containing protein [Hahella sp. SMD15-11]|uniref:PilZ domain-containing protein n=1 Tax=Thermohahella caldifontis TaxID=3142973 RepID=A0AB39UWY2_9GAMM
MTLSKDQESRRSPRIKATFKVELSHPELGVLVSRTRDISEGGAFVILNESISPTLHMRIRIRVIGLPMGAGEPVESEVIRIEDEGIALKFVDS